ncbi:MgtC/SapB family protein [Chitinophaga horti]|uniref:MgtC/SapB family protein n=1 Tax=Chitinophaga horti TaxID=2920382 RepID=A0ABY6J9Q3_9BACT|nr:MgtC/SapB family protein [Chitinophaga horti]UYQ95072.1 MgtC/SapB family protein [Chitinophaga horti]
MDLHLFNESLQILASLAMGSVLGLEREYRRKAAGIRTIALISAGSTLFTVLSREMGAPDSMDRVASNILTGVGFIGAGVIFKGKYSVDGITTATTIWIAAALGMAIGMNHYMLALLTLAGSLLVLTGLRYLEHRLELQRKRKQFSIHCGPDLSHIQLEAIFAEKGLKFKSLVISRHDDRFEYKYEITGSVSALDDLNEYLLAEKRVFSFNVEVTY